MNKIGTATLTNIKKKDDQSSIMDLDIDEDKLDMLYKVALLDNKISLTDLEYQTITKAQKKVFKHLVVAAFTLQAVKEMVLNEERNTKSRSKKITRKRKKTI